MELGELAGPISVVSIVRPTGPSGEAIDPPSYFIDGAKIQFSQVGITLVLLRTKLQLGGEPAASEAVALLHMSPGMGGSLALLLINAIQTLQDQMAHAATASEPTEAPGGADALSDQPS